MRSRKVLGSRSSGVHHVSNIHHVHVINLSSYRVFMCVYTISVEQTSTRVKKQRRAPRVRWTSNLTYLCAWSVCSRPVLVISKLVLYIISNIRHVHVKTTDSSYYVCVCAPSVWSRPVLESRSSGVHHVSGWEDLDKRCGRDRRDLVLFRENLSCMYVYIYVPYVLDRQI